MDENDAAAKVGSNKEKIGRAGLYATVQQKSAEALGFRGGGARPPTPWLRPSFTSLNIKRYD